MNPKKAAILQIITALAFAGAILYSSWILGDSEHTQTITYILIALYIIPFSLLSTMAVKEEKNN